MRSHLKLVSRDAPLTVAGYVDALSAKLRIIRAGRVLVRGATIALDVDSFALSFTWSHPFKGVSSAEFHVTSEPDGLRVEYSFSVIGMILWFIPFTIVAMAMSHAYPPSLSNLVGPPVSVAFVFALNVVTDHIKIRRVLRQVGQELGAVAG